MRPVPTRVRFHYSQQDVRDAPEVLICQWCFRELSPDMFVVVRGVAYGTCCRDCLKKRDRGELIRDRAAYEKGLDYTQDRYDKARKALYEAFAFKDDNDVDALALKLVLEAKRLVRLREFMDMLDMGADPETAEVPEE